MTDARILKVLERYALDLPHDITWDSEWGNGKLSHCYGMIPQIREFLADGRREKAFRWLGFMQGVFYAEGIYTIEEMAEHNRPQGEVNG